MNGKLHHVAWLVVAMGLATCSQATAADEMADLAARAATVLERNCVTCHRGAGSASKAQFDVRVIGSMVDAGVVAPGQPDDSLLWELAHRGTMPPRSQPQLVTVIAADTQVLRDWIQAGAPPFPMVRPRPPISLATSLQWIRDDLKQLKDDLARGRQRYFSLIELSNTPTASPHTLTMARAALAKALNSLSWEHDLIMPRAIDPGQTLFAVDLQQLGWSREHWRTIRVRYPYTLGFEPLEDPRLNELEREIVQLADNGEPLYRVRADWFIATALQPALYHALLYDLSLPVLRDRLPDARQPANPKQMTAGDLERELGIDVIQALTNAQRVARCGFTSSGVSGQNRLLERHVTKFGAYWKSYDFKADNRRSILTQFPLGPNFDGHPFPKLAFEQDGGEIIFHLPNGLQGYLLIDAQDRRIDAGPIEVVSDALKTSGTPAIVTGLSCVSCHKDGMINPPADEIRQFARVFLKERELVRRLYPAVDEFQKLIDDDARKFATQLERAIGPLLRTGADADRGMNGFREPISELARSYLLEELDLPTVAAELYEPNVDRLRVELERNELLKQLGLAVLLRPDGKIKRAFWEGARGGASVMQLTAFELGYSTPQFK